MHAHASSPTPAGDHHRSLPDELTIRRITLDDAVEIRQYIEFSNAYDVPPAITLEMLEASADRPGRRGRWIATSGSRVVGIASTVEWVEQRDGSYWVNVVVARTDLGRGYRSALAEAVRAFLLDGGGRRLFANSRDTLPHELAFWRARGLEVVEEHPAVSLDLAAAIALPAIPDIDGLELVTLAERPDLERPLWEAATSLIWPDEPTDIEIVEHEPFDEFQRYIHRHPCGSPDLVTIALVDGKIAGYLHLGLDDPPVGSSAAHWFTGVCRGYRGRGLALAMKLHGIEVARSRGIEQLRTSNHERNAPMRHINAKLGYRREYVSLNLSGPVW